ncbi:MULTISPECIES: helix-turn-helix domain-containing protein [Alistipes]|uniref:helix-turn-helix domain-containing protein n=1 Tax=Alistipes TaxID=239759 RepID=UPI001F5CBDFB|nr:MULTISPECIES: helix-turn-helix transcriptional regulator [Alistipes]
MLKKTRYYVNQELVEQIAQRIKDLRNKHGHTQEFLIEKIHLSINSYEAGTKIPTLMSLFKICEFYGIELSEFFATINCPSTKK